MIIQSRRVWVDEEFIPCQIEIKNDVISRVLSYDYLPVDMDFDDNRILPGFIDIHCHGGYGYDTNENNQSGLLNWKKELPKEGVTSFLPTTVTDDSQILKDAIQNVAIVKEDNRGANILGVHLEGPFINEEFKGAQPEQYIQKGCIDTFKEIGGNYLCLIKLVTLAPEVNGNIELMQYLAKNNVVVSIGHSGATYEQAKEAHLNGATSVTHTFNAMAPFHHRRDSLLTYALTSDIYSEVIADGFHCSIPALKLFFKSKPVNKTIIVSDSLLGKGLPVGSILTFGKHKISITKDKTAKLFGTNTLAGSTLKLNEALKKVIEDAGISNRQAINSLTINPATLLNLNNKGLIKVGYDADLIVLDDVYDVIYAMVREKFKFVNLE